MKATAIVLAAVLLVVGPVRGDRLELTDGRTLTGRVLAQTADVLMFRDESGETVTLDRAQVRQVIIEAAPPPAPPTPAAPATPAPPLASQPDAPPPPSAPEPGPSASPAESPPPGPPDPAPQSSASLRSTREPALRAGFLVLELRGLVGADIRAERLKADLGRFLPDAPNGLVLLLDSAGGDIADAEEVVSLLEGLGDARRLAVVRRATEEAAPIALCCGEIYLAQHAALGASAGPQARKIDPADADRWRTLFVRAAKAGGHDPALANAMVQADQALTLTGEPGKRQLRVGDNPGGFYRTRLVQPGERLTLQFRNAIDSGLAKGQAGNLEQLAEAIRADELRAFGAVDLFGDPAGSARSVVFVIDSSGSMARAFPLVREELSLALGRLREDQRFAVIFYADRAMPVEVVKPFGLLAATPANIEAARRAVDGRQIQPPRGRTDPSKALELALSIRGGAPDLVYFLTDGGFPKEGLSELSKANAAGRTRICTVALDATPDAWELLRQLAEDHGGTYRQMDSTTLQERVRQRQGPAQESKPSVQ